jgi:hypothetical protein
MAKTAPEHTRPRARSTLFAYFAVQPQFPPKPETSTIN